MADIKPEIKTRNLSSLINNPSVPKLFANSFFGGHSPTEAIIVPQVGSEATAIIFMSFPTLKALHKTLGTVIEKIETGLGEEIDDFEELKSRFAKNTPSIEKSESI